MHSNSVTALAGRHSQQKINEILDQSIKNNKKENREMLVHVIEAVRYLSRQGLALRGASNDTEFEPNSNLMQLLYSYTKFSPGLDSLLKKSITFTSPTCVNDILSCMSKLVLRKVVSDIKKAKYYSLMLDETPDVGGKEQLVICFRYTKSC